MSVPDENYKISNMRADSKYYLGFNDIKRFGLTTPQNSSNSSDLESFAESIFSNGEFDFKKMLMLQMAMSNPFMAAIFMNKMNPQDAIKKEFSPDKEARIGFRGLEKKDNEYLNNLATVSDVKRNNTKFLDKDEQKFAEKTGDFSASKDSIAIIDKDGQNVTDDFKDIIKDGKIDTKEAENKYKELEKLNKNNLSTESIKKLIADKDKVKDLNIDNYENYGIDVTYSSDEVNTSPKTELTSKGQKQLDLLKSQGVIDANGKILDISGLDKQLKENTQKETLKDASEGKNIYVKTENGTEIDTYSKANVDKNGKIAGTEKDAETQKLKHTEAAVADKKIKIGSLDDEEIKKITTVNKDGSVEINLSKLDSTQYNKIKENGIDYNNNAPLTITDNKGEKITIRLAGDANTVNLKGKANTNIETDNKELQVNSDEYSSVSDIKGDKLEHLVIKGGKLDTDLKNLNALQAIKIEKANVSQDLDISNNKNKNIALNIADSNTKIISVGTTGDADVRIADSKTGDINAGGNNIVTTLSHVTAQTVSINAEKEASFRGYKGSVADNIQAVSENINVNFNGMNVKEQANFSSVTGKTEMFVSKDSKAGNLNLKDNSEIVAENESTKKDLAENVSNAKNIRKLGSDDGDASTEELLTKFFDFNEVDLARYEGDISRNRYNAQPYGWGATPTALGGGSNAFTNFFNGWAFGGQLYNQIYGNPYGQQYYNQPYNPWMVQGGYFG